MNRALVFLKAPGQACLRKQALAVLFRATAQAFGAPVPPLARLSADECLLQYALFTQRRVEEALRNGADLPAIQEQLYRNAYRLGRVCRWVARVHTIEDTMAAGQALYRLLGTELQGDEDGDILIGSCYFSRFYSGQACKVMSAMDRGLFAGLSNGRQIVFSARITEGHAQCIAHLHGRNPVFGKKPGF